VTLCHGDDPIWVLRPRLFSVRAGTEGRKPQNWGDAARFYKRFSS
jgi:hypothetical protein